MCSVSAGHRGPDSQAMQCGSVLYDNWSSEFLPEASTIIHGMRVILPYIHVRAMM